MEPNKLIVSVYNIFNFIWATAVLILVRGVIDTAHHWSMVASSLQSSVAEPHRVPHTVLHPDPVLYPDPVLHLVPHTVPHLDLVPQVKLEPDSEP
jgi:hypothetical protein